MPVSIDWGNSKKTIIHIKFMSPWTWEEYYTANQNVFDLIDSVEHKVCLLIDFTESNGHLPPSAFTHFRKAATSFHPRVRVIIVTSPRMMLVKMMVSMVQKIGRVKLRILFAQTTEEAYQVLEHLLDEKPETIHLR
ncbi:MAG: hypothetical protein Q9P01_14725 [Anaerolineae bacterium]|nr:hypothetical protein [Anaerolineae bacterium]MDQ7036036.1 hypothetical protein [Anaerolineae bacterium]